MYKILLLAIAVVVTMYVIIELRYNEDVIVEQVETVEVTPTADQLFEEAVLKTIEEAVTASSSDIEAAKVEAAAQVELEMKEEIEERVRKEMRDLI